MFGGVSFAASTARRVFGGNVDRALLPVLAVGLSGSIAGGTLWSFIGIWAIDHLGASNAQLGFTFLVSAVLAAAGGFLGGHLSDRYGRRPLILLGWSFGATVPLVLLAVGDNLWWGLGALSVLGFFFSIGHAADQALVPDLVPVERHESGYAAVRVANNLGITFGPPLGGLLLLGENWNRLFLGAFVLYLIPVALAFRLIPRRGAYSPEKPSERSSFRLITRDRLFLLFFAAGCFSTLVYVTFETVLPISLVDTHGMAPSTWGFLLIVNPAMVTLFQLRLTARVVHVPASVKLTSSVLLMGLPFLLLTVTSSLGMVAIILFVFVIGEMLWIPTSQAVVARIAPADVRGAYIGAFSSTFAVGFALTPFAGLQVRGAYGDSAMWAMFATLSLVGAAVGFIACSKAFGVRGVATGPLEDAAVTELAAPSPVA